MLVDRNLIVDLIALELKRETGYRHPPCIVVRPEEIIHSFRRARRARRELCREHPCTDIELIEERFDSNPWLCVYSLCV